MNKLVLILLLFPAIALAEQPEPWDLYWEMHEDVFRAIEGRLQCENELGAKRQEVDVLLESTKVNGDEVLKKLDSLVLEVRKLKRRRK